VPAVVVTPAVISISKEKGIFALVFSREKIGLEDRAWDVVNLVTSLQWHASSSYRENESKKSSAAEKSNQKSLRAEAKKDLLPSLSLRDQPSMFFFVRDSSAAELLSPSSCRHRFFPDDPVNTACLILKTKG